MGSISFRVTTELISGGSETFLADVENNGTYTVPVLSINEFITIRAYYHPSFCTTPGPLAYYYLRGSDVLTGPTGSGDAPGGFNYFLLFGHYTCSEEPLGWGGYQATITATTPPGTYVLSGDVRMYKSNTGGTVYDQAEGTITIIVPGTPPPPTRATPTITTQVSAASVGAGVPFRDMATISGGNAPSGNLEFNLFREGSPFAIFSSVVPISGNGTYASAPYATLVGGRYSWGVYYSGDVRNQSAESIAWIPNEITEVFTSSPPGYRDVRTRVVLDAPRAGDVGTRVVIGGLIPSVARYSQADAHRLWIVGTPPGSTINTTPGPSGSPFAPGDITIGSSFGYYEAIAKEVLHKQWVQADDELGNVMRVSGESFEADGMHDVTLDDPDQMADYAPHDVVWLPDGSGLAVLIARLNGTLELWKYDLNGNVTAQYTGLATDPDWTSTKYCKIDALCDSTTVLYTDRGRTIFRYDMTGAGTQLTNFSQLPLGSPYIYAAFKVLTPTDEVVVAMTNYGDGPSDALCLDSDRLAMWTDQTSLANASPARIYKRFLADGTDTGNTYVVRGTPVTLAPLEVPRPYSLACWDPRCILFFPSRVVRVSFIG